MVRMKMPSRLNTVCVAALCCTLFLFQVVNVGAASDGGDVDDWSNQRMVYAILSLVIIFMLNVDSEFFKDNADDDLSNHYCLGLVYDHTWVLVDRWYCAIDCLANSILCSCKSGELAGFCVYCSRL